MPRQGLTTDRVCAAAADLADELGLDRVTIAAVARPDRTMPTCSTSQKSVPARGRTCSDHFHPGSYVARPMVSPPM